MKTDKKSILIGLMFMIIGIFFMFIFGQTTDLSCAKNDVGKTECTKTVKFLGVVPLSTGEFRDVYRAEVEESCDEDGCSYRVVLMTIDGQRPMTSYYTSDWSGKEQIAAQINTFIGATANRGPFFIQEQSGLWPSLFSMIFVLVGLYQLILKGLIQPNQVD